jgi:acetyl/propionyl-CoA carboxylase alpha subunit
MKLSTNSRHLRFQLLADEYGDAVALNGCSVQRRHQKSLRKVLSPLHRKFEGDGKGGCNFAKPYYTNAGTVETLYRKGRRSPLSRVNPRLQVEHPVTEMVT